MLHQLPSEILTHILAQCESKDVVSTLMSSRCTYENQRSTVLKAHKDYMIIEMHQALSLLSRLYLPTEQASVDVIAISMHAHQNGMSQSWQPSNLQIVNANELNSFQMSLDDSMVFDVRINHSESWYKIPFEHRTLLMDHVSFSHHELSARIKYLVRRIVKMNNTTL